MLLVRHSRAAGVPERAFIKYLGNEPKPLGNLEPIGEVNTKLIPDNWAPAGVDTDNSFALLGKEKHITYKNQAGETVTGDLSVYRKAGTGEFFVKAGYIIDDTWVAGNPFLTDFYVLFNETRSWGQHWDEMASFINALNAEQRTTLFGILSGDSFKGTGVNGITADEIMEAIRVDIGTNESFKLLLAADVRRFDACAISMKNLDNLASNDAFLTKFTKDLYEPVLPTGSTITAGQIRSALQDPDLYAFYKKFWNFEYFNDNMRKKIYRSISNS